MKKTLSILLSSVVLCLLSLSAVAQPTINASNVDRGAAKWYVIKNKATGDYLRYEGRRFPMSLTDGTFSNGGSTATNLDTYNMFYLTKAGDGSNTCHIHTFETNDLCAEPGLWNASGAVWAIETKNGTSTITLEGAAMHYNSEEECVDLYLASDANSEWVFEQITEFGAITGLNALAEQANTVTDGLDFWWLLGNLSWGNADKWWSTITEHGPAVDDILEKNHTTLAEALTDIDKLNKIMEDLNDVVTNIVSYTWVNIYTSSGQYLSNNTTSLTVNSTVNTHANVWKLEEESDLSYYLFNEATNLYIGIPDKNTGAVSLVSDKNLAGLYTISFTELKNDITTTAIQSLDWTSGYLYISGSNVICSTNKTTWNIKATADVTITDALYTQAANMAWQYPYTLQQLEGIVKHSTEDCEPYYSNALPNGSTTCNLHDGVYTTSCTTSKSIASGEHWIAVDLGSAVKEFRFYIKADLQRTDARPKTIRVEGSNSKNSGFTTLTTVTTTLADDMYYFSPLISSSTAYRYIRLVVTAVNSGDGSFSLSELYFFPNNTNVTNCYNNINNFYTTSLAGDGIITRALELVKMEAKYYLDNSSHSTTPVVGQYLTADYNSLQTAYNNVSTTISTITALSTALENFKNSKCRPVFMVTSAWEDGYSDGWAVSYDTTNKSFAAAKANTWDLRQWFAHSSLESETMQATSSIHLRSVVGDKDIMNAQQASIEPIDGWNTLYGSANDAWNVRLNNGQNFMTVDRYMTLTQGTSAATTSGNKNAAWYFTYVGTSAALYGLNVTNNDHLAFVEALAEFGEVYAQATAYQKDYDAEGTGALGKYKYVSTDKEMTYEKFADLCATAETHYNKGAEAIAKAFLAGSSDYTADKMKSRVDEIKAHFPNFKLNTPPSGYYFRIKGRLSGKYLHSDLKGNDLVMSEDKGPSSIFYSCEGEEEGAINMLAFNDGRYIKYEGQAYIYDRIPLDNDKEFKSQNVYVRSSATETEGYFALDFGNGNYMLDQATVAKSQTKWEVNRGLDWTIEAVSELAVEVTQAQMTSLCVPVELVIPDGVTAYILTGKENADGSHLNAIDYTRYEEGTAVFNLEQVECGVIPAGMPVIIKAAAGVHYFPINYTPTLENDDEAVEYLASRNMLEGTHDVRLIEERANVTHMILAKKDGRVGMYKVTMTSAANRGLDYVTTATFINQTRRAWLPFKTTQQATGYAFAIGGRGDGTTDVEEVKGESREVKGIYDLQGRKVNGKNLKLKGIYIIDGKKTFIK